jgi:hypothetical protein
MMALLIRCSSGPLLSTATIGSKTIESDLRVASLKAIEAAILKADSLDSS